MPYAIVKRDAEWCVVRLATGGRDQETKGCHPTKAKADAHLAALEIHARDEG